MSYSPQRDDGDGVAREEYSSATPILDLQQQQVIADVSAVPRCPRCRTLLIARITSRGPYFPCHCAGHRCG